MQSSHLYLQMVGYSPRMPKPEYYPVAPPAIGKGKSKGKSKGTKKAVNEKEYPQGRKYLIATSCAACLRYMTSCPGFIEQLMGEL